VPYYSRKEIDGGKVLAGKGLEAAYLKDPLDVLVLQIQGSGRLIMGGDEEYLAAYAGKNGRPYKSIGRYLADEGMLPKEEVSWGSIKEFLKEHPEKLEEVLYSNPSYVFFELKKAEKIVGSLGVPLSPFHSIAVDNHYIPPLSFCLISLQIPLIGEDGLVKTFVPLAEFAFAMDEGSAILGPARADIFLGSGDDAEKLAGALKSEGELYFLIPRETSGN
jgi:membrane-bound lytic murein transglycosylase A